MEGVVVDVAGVVVSGLVPGEIQHVLVALIYYNLYIYNISNKAPFYLRNMKLYH